MKKTLVVGATDNPTRFAYKATQRLLQYGHPIELLGLKKGNIGGHEIQQGQPSLQGVDTITLYVGPQNQPPLYDYLLSLQPKRIIFNPGTENEELKRLAKEKGIETTYDCTLIMLSAGDY
jgi:hypothetical protein